MSTLVNVLSTTDTQMTKKNKWVRVEEIKADSFFDWDTWLGKFYSLTVQGSSKFHLFHYESMRPLQCRVVAGQMEDETKVDLHKKVFSILSTENAKNNWKHNLKLGNPEPIERVGLNKRKQVELWEKWRKVVPKAYHDELCPKPDEDVMKQVKNDIKEKIKQKKAMKKGNNNKDGETPVQLD